MSDTTSTSTERSPSRAQQAADLKALLAEPRSIAILTHARPDGDAMGSSLGLMLVLRQMGHEARVIVPNAYADFLAWLPGLEGVLDHQTQTEQAAEILAEAEVVFCLDFNTPGRLESLAQRLLKSDATRVMIDHHRDPDAFTRFRWHDTGASSTAELVYAWMEDMGELDRLNLDVATCLYIGMLTDTGSFRYSSTGPRTLRVAAALLEHGVDVETCYARIYHTFSEDRMRFFGHCLVNKMQVFPEYRTGLIHVNRAELERFNIRTGDTEGLVNYPLSIQGIVFSAFIVDRTNLVKLSLRSKGDLNVDAIAREHFSGGGHRNASGGISSTDLESTVQKFIDLLPTIPGLKADA
jgi:phosphoesterase RecJ-like protein